MIVIKRSRNSGKTTILLHHMVIDPLAIYVARTEAQAAKTYLLAQILELGLSSTRFLGMTDPKLIKLCEHRYKILVDDADVITERYPELGFNLIAHASVITISK